MTKQATLTETIATLNAEMYAAAERAGQSAAMHAAQVEIMHGAGSFYATGYVQQGDERHEDDPARRARDLETAKRAQAWLVRRLAARPVSFRGY